jgi:hypothetical protein
MGFDVGAGFYSSIRGQLPYAFAPVPDETYELVPLREVTSGQLNQR